MNKRILPYVSGLTFAVIFGFSFLIVKNALDEVRVFQLLGLRFLLAAGVFEILRLTKAVSIKLSGKMFKAILPVAVFQPILYFVCEVYGINNSQSSEAGLMIGMIPIAVALVSWIFLKERLNLKQGIFMAMSLGGVALISIIQMNGSEGHTRPLGYLLLSGAVISAAAYNVLSRKTSRTYKPIEITYVMMIVGAVVFNIFGITDSIINGYSYLAPLANISTVMAILYLGILSSILAFFCLNYTLSKIPAVQSSLFANLVTAISVAAGVVFLNESFTWYKVLGSILIIAGVIGTNYFQNSIRAKQQIKNTGGV